MAVGAGVVKAGRAYVEIFADNSRFNQKLRETEATFRNFGSQMTQASAQMLSSITAIAAPLALSSKFYAEFDDTMRSVYSTAGKIAKVDMYGNGLGSDLKNMLHIGRETEAQARAINQEFLNLTKTARELGATTSYTAKEAANAMLVLARAGFEISEIQDSVRHILNLARATGTEVAESTQIMIGALRAFNIEASKSEQVVNLLVATANSSPQALSDIGSAMKYIGPVAKSLHLSLRDTLADLGALANFNIKGEQGGTALRNIYLRLASAKNQAKLKNTFGVDIVGADGEFRKIVPVLKEIKEQIDKTGMSTADVANSFKEIFGMRSAPAALSLMNADLDRINAALADVTDLAEKQSHMMDEGLGGAIRMLISRFQELQIAMVNAFSGPATIGAKVLTKVFNVAAKFIEQNKWLVKTIAYVAGTVGSLVATFGAISLAIGVATRSASSFMTQMRKLSTAKLAPITSLFKNLSSYNLNNIKLGTPDIQTSSIDKAREATRYLNENLSSLSKTTVNIIARFNRLSKSFDMITKKADAFRQASVKFAQFGQILNDVVRPMESYVRDATSSFNGLVKSINAARASVNRFTQSGIRATTSTSRIVAAIETLERRFYNIEREMGRFVTATNDVRAAIRATTSDSAALRDVTRRLAEELKSVTQIGKNINKTFKSTADNLSSSAVALHSFNQKMIEVSQTANLDTWSQIATKIKDVASAFSSLSAAVRGFNSAFRQIGRLSSKSVKKVLEITTMFDSVYDPKAFLAFANNRQKEYEEKKLAKQIARANRPSGSESSAGKLGMSAPQEVHPKETKTVDINEPGFGRRLITKAELSQKVVDIFKGIATSLSQSARAVARFLRSVVNGVDNLSTSLTTAKDSMSHFQQNLSKFIGNTRNIGKEFNTLTNNIKATVDATAQSIRRIRQYRESLKSLSLQKLINDTNKLEKGMVNLSASLNYLLQNHTAIENSIMSIGVAFERAALGATTMAEAVKSIVTNLRQIQPTMRTVEKRIKTGGLGKSSGKSDAIQGQYRILTLDQMRTELHKGRLSANRTMPQYNDNLIFATMDDLRARQKRIETLEGKVRARENVLTSLKMKDRLTEHEVIASKIGKRMLLAHDAGQKTETTRASYLQADVERAAKEAEALARVNQAKELETIRADGEKLVANYIQKATRAITNKTAGINNLKGIVASDEANLESLRAQRAALVEEQGRSNSTYTTKQIEEGLALYGPNTKIIAELLNSDPSYQKLQEQKNEKSKALRVKKSRTRFYTAAKNRLSGFLEANKGVDWKATTETVDAKLYADQKALQAQLDSAQTMFDSVSKAQMNLESFLKDEQKQNKSLNWNARREEVNPSLFTDQSTLQGRVDRESLTLKEVEDAQKELKGILGSKNSAGKKFNWDAKRINPSEDMRVLEWDKKQIEEPLRVQEEELRQVEKAQQELKDIIATEKKDKINKYGRKKGKVNWSATSIDEPVSSELIAKQEALEKAVQDKRSLIESTKQSIAKASARIKDKISGLGKLNKAVEDEIKGIDKQIKDKQTEIKTAQQRVDKLVGSIAKNGYIPKVNRDNLKLLQEEEFLASSIKAARAKQKKNDELITENTRYRDRNTPGGKRYKEAENNITGLSSQNAALQSEIERLENSLSIVRDQIDRKLLFNNHRNQTTYSGFAPSSTYQEITSAEKAIAELQKEIASLTSQREAKTAGINRRTGLAEFFKSLLIGGTKTRTAKVDAAMQELTALESELTSVNQQIVDARKAAEQHNATVPNPNRLARKTELEGLLAGMTKGFSSVEEWITARINSIAELKGRLSKATSLIEKEPGRISSWNATVPPEELVKRRDELVARIAKLTGGSSDVDAWIAAKTTELKSLTDTLAGITSTIKSEQKRVDKHNATVPSQELLAQKAELERAVTSLTGGLVSDVYTFLQGKKGEIEALASQINNLGQTIKQKESEVGKHNAVVPTDALRTQRAKLEKSVAFWKNKVQEAETSVIGFNNEIARLQKEIDPLQRALLDSSKELKKWRNLSKGMHGARTIGEIQTIIQGIDSNIQRTEAAIQSRMTRIEQLGRQVENIQASLAPLSHLAEASKSGIIGTTLAPGTSLLDLKPDDLRARQEQFIKDYFKSVTQGGPASGIISVNPNDPSVTNAVNAGQEAYRAALYDSNNLQEDWQKLQNDYKRRVDSIIHDTKDAGNGRKLEGVRSNLVRSILDDNLTLVQKQLAITDQNDSNFKALTQTARLLKALVRSAQNITATSKLNQQNRLDRYNTRFEALRATGIKGLQGIQPLPPAITNTAEAEASGLLIPKAHDIYIDNGRTRLPGFRSTEVREALSSNKANYEKLIANLRQAGFSSEAKQLSSIWEQQVYGPISAQGKTAYTGQGILANKPFVEGLNTQFASLNGVFESPLSAIHDVKIGNTGIITKGSRADIVRNVIAKNLELIRNARSVGAFSGKPVIPFDDLSKLETLFSGLSKEASFIGQEDKLNTNAYISPINRELFSAAGKGLTGLRLIPSPVTNMAEADQAGYLTTSIHDTKSASGKIVKGARSEKIRETFAANKAVLQRYFDFMTQLGHSSEAQALQKSLSEIDQLIQKSSFIGSRSKMASGKSAAAIDKRFPVWQDNVDRAVQAMSSQVNSWVQEYNTLTNDWNRFHQRATTRYNQLASDLQYLSSLNQSDYSPAKWQEIQAAKKLAKRRMGKITARAIAKKQDYDQQIGSLTRQINDAAKPKSLRSMPDVAKTVNEAISAGYLPQGYSPESGFSATSFKPLPATVSSVEEAKAAGYLDKQHTSGALTSQTRDTSNDSRRAGRMRVARESLERERTRLQEEKANNYVTKKMESVIGKGGVANQLLASRKHFKGITQRMANIEKIAAERDLTFEERLKYDTLRYNLSKAQVDLEKKEAAHDKAVAKAKKDIVKAFKGTNEYQEYKKANDDLQKAKKSGDEGAIASASKTYKQKKSAYDNLVRSTLSYREIQDRVVNAKAQVDDADKRVAAAQKRKDDFAATRAANKKDLQEATGRYFNARNEQMALEKKYRWTPKMEGIQNPMTPEDKARYERLERERRESLYKSGELRKSRREITKNQQEAAKDYKQEVSNASVAKKNLERAQNLLYSYGQSLPDSPEARARARAQRRGAIGNLASGRRNWRMQTAQMRNAFSGLGKSFKTLGQYASELTKSMFGVGDASKRTTLRLKSAAVGFNIAAFAAGIFTKMTMMVGTMLQMTVVMAIVGAIVSLFTWLGKTVWGLMTKTSAERAEERREKRREKYNEAMEKSNSRLEKAENRRNETEEKVDRLRELSKKESLTESEADEARKLSHQISPNRETQAFSTRVEFNKEGKPVIKGSINEAVLKDAEEKQRVEYQKALLLKAKDMAYNYPTHWYNNDEEGMLQYLDEHRAELNEIFDQLESSGAFNNEENKELLNEFIDLLDNNNRADSYESSGYFGDVVRFGTGEPNEWSEMSDRARDMKKNNGNSGYKDFDVKAVKDAIEPFEKDVEEISNRRKVDPGEVQDAYDAYIEQLEKNLDNIRNNFDRSKNKTEMGDAIKELEDKLNKAYESFETVNISIQNEIRRALPSYGADAMMNDLMDNAVKGLDHINQLEEAENKRIDKKAERDQKKKESEITNEYKKYETNADIDADINSRIAAIEKNENYNDEQKKDIKNKLEEERKNRKKLETNEEIDADINKRIQEIDANKDYTDEKKKELKSKLEEERNDRKQRTKDGGYTKEFVDAKKAKRDKELADAKAAIETQKTSAKDAAKTDFEKKREGVYNATGAALQEKIDKEMMNAISTARKPFEQAQQNRIDALRSLNIATDAQAWGEYQEELTNYNLKYKNGEMTASQHKELVDKLEQNVNSRKTELRNSEEYRNRVAEINQDYESEISNIASPKTESSIYQKALEQKKKAETELEADRWNKANNAVEYDLEKLAQLKSVDEDERDNKAIAELEKSIKTKRQAAYNATADYAKQQQAHIDKEFEEASNPDNILLDANSYKGTAINEEKQRRDADKRVEDWRQAVAENAVKEDKAKLKELEEAKPEGERTDEEKKAISDLKTKIETTRKRVYEKNDSRAREEQAKLYQDIDDAFLREQSSKSFATQQKFNESDYNLDYEAKTNTEYLDAAKKDYSKAVEKNKEYGEANELLMSYQKDLNYAETLAASGETEINGVDINTVIASLNNAIDSQKKFIAGHEKEVGEYNAAVNRLKEVNILDVMAKAYYEAAKSIQEIKAYYAKKQFDYGLQMYGKESVELNADKDRETKLAELKRDYQERLAYVEDEQEKIRLKNNYETAVKFIEKQADFKKKFALAEQNDFSRPIQKKAAEITVKWQQEIIDALEANGIGLDEVEFDRNGEIQGRSGRAKTLVRMGKATRNAQIAAEEFNEEKANQDYQNDVAKYTGSQNAINDLDLAIESLQAFSNSPNSMVAQAASVQMNQMKYNKALLETRQFDTQLATLQDQASRAYEIWQDTVKQGATDEEKRNAFERYKQLVDEMQSVKSSMINSFQDMQDSRREIATATTATEKSNTGTFKAMEASRNSQDWQRENSVRQTTLLKQIADNTGFSGEII